MSRTIQVALIGQPNVGKSTLFTRITGVGVISSNYPGTTVEFDEGTVTRDDLTIHVHDLPGTYSLSANSDDEKVVIDMLRDRSNDAIIIVADAMNLEPTLVLCFEVMELGYPTILVLNKYDLASKKYDIDIDKMSALLDVPVVPVSSKTGEGVSALVDLICSGKARVSKYRVRYDSHIMSFVDELENMMPNRTPTTWGECLKMVEGLDQFVEAAPDNVIARLSEMNEEFYKIHGEPMNMHIARDRYGEAHIITMDTVKRTARKMTRAEKLSDMTVTPITGIPILIGVVLVILASLIFLGSYLAELIDWAYTTVVGTALIDFGRSIGGELGESILRGIDDSFRAILGLVIPYIMVFYIILGFLEDTGYLPRAVVLLDTSMHKLGLHGGSFIPMMVGLGCNVPAIMATRSIRSKRERLILVTLIVMAIPCSAQLATIVGVTGKFAGMIWAVAIFATLVAIALIVGIVMNKFLKYEPSNLAIELPELQWPKLSNIFYKMWMRTKDFFVIAVPLLIVGSVIVELAIHYNLLDGIIGPMSWLTVGLLGLPASLIIAFIVGIIRKEMAYAMLIILAGEMSLTEFMTPDQFVVFGVVMAVYMPCLATLTAMFKEIGMKQTAIVSLASIIVAVAVGSAFNLLLSVV